MNAQLDNISVMPMLLVRIPLDLIHVNAYWVILEMELHVTVRKLKLLCEFSRSDAHLMGDLQIVF